MRIIDAEALAREMCAGCNAEACEGNGRKGYEKCYAIQVILDAPTVELWIQTKYGAIH